MKKKNKNNMIDKDALLQELDECSKNIKKEVEKLEKEKTSELMMELQTGLLAGIKMAISIVEHM